MKSEYHVVRVLVKGGSDRGHVAKNAEYEFECILVTEDWVTAKKAAIEDFYANEQNPRYVDTDVYEKFSFYKPVRVFVASFYVEKEKLRELEDI